VDRRESRKPDARLRMVRLAEGAKERPVLEGSRRQVRNDHGPVSSGPANAPHNFMKLVRDLCYPFGEPPRRWPRASSGRWSVGEIENPRAYQIGLRRAGGERQRTSFSEGTHGQSGTTHNKSRPQRRCGEATPCWNCLTAVSSCGPKTPSTINPRLGVRRQSTPLAASA
jgi:hypothetical protein